MEQLERRMRMVKVRDIAVTIDSLAPPDYTLPKNAVVYFKGQNPAAGHTDQDNFYKVKPGSQVGWRYEITEVNGRSRLGKGGFGAVYVAQDHCTNQLVALKIIKKFKRSEHRRLALKELSFLKSLNEQDKKGDKFVRVIEHFMFREHLCIAMEYFDAVTKKILQQLVLLNDAGIVHADIKPDNILIRFKPLDVRIIDFGLARYTSEADSSSGTRFYQAPEIVVDMKCKSGPPADMWALGISLTELVCSAPLIPLERKGLQIDSIMDAFRIKQFPRKGEKVDTRSAIKGHFKDRLPEEEIWKEYCHFVCCLIKWWPEDRWPPEEALRHPWLTKWMPVSNSRR